MADPGTPCSGIGLDVRLATQEFNVNSGTCLSVVFSGEIHYCLVLIWFSRGGFLYSAIIKE